MAKNERNAGRKPKYANKCKQVGFNLPLDVLDEVKEKVREIVRTKAKRFGEPTIAEIKEVLMNTHVIDLNTGNTKRIKDLFEKAEFPCGCSIENNLLKRGKGKCKLSKEEHLAKTNEIL
jgi:hypothetical protein